MEAPEPAAVEVVGLGVATLDLLSRVEHFPGGEGVQQALETSLQGGGPVATALVTLARLGARTALLDCLGDDWRSRQIRAELQQEGVDTTWIATRPGQSASIATVLVRASTGERSIIYAPGTCGELQPEELPEALLRRARILHVNGRHWTASLEAVRVARAAGVKISFDGGAHRFRPELRGLMPQVDYCIAARQFAQAYTGHAQPAAAAAALLDEGPELVVITAGLEGSWVYPRGGEALYAPAVPLGPTVDSTGCGDTYHGAFLFGLLRGFGLAETARLASRVAAAVAQRLGGRAGLPYRRDLPKD
jgi:sugar/nucleoside kinase (ribokinase family)